jgi:hypothetical protein
VALGGLSKHVLAILLGGGGEVAMLGFGSSLGLVTYVCCVGSRQ